MLFRLVEVTGEMDTAVDPVSDAGDMARACLEGVGIPIFLDIVPFE